MRIEPKTFFANERTFLTWLHMAVTIGTIAAALLGFSGSAQRSKEPAYDVTPPPLLPAQSSCSSVLAMVLRRLRVTASWLDCVRWLRGMWHVVMQG